MHGIHNGIDLDQNTCPIRENRIGSIKAYYGKTSELVEDTAEGRLAWKDRSFQQCAVCVFQSASERLMSIRDAVIITHSPVGCGVALYGYREIFNNIPEGKDRPRIDLHSMNSNISENDIVYGGERKLRETILEAERRYAPRSIFVLNSCATGILGDDIEGVVNSVQPDVRATIVPVRCEGFRSRVPQTGFDAIFHAVVKYLVREPREKQKDLVNIIAPFSVTWGDRQELTRLLGALGLRANFVPEFATTSQLEMLSEAAVTATTCPSFADYAQKALFEKYGVPYVRTPVPIGMENTANWLRNVAKHTGKEKEAEELIEKEMAAIAPQVKALKDAFGGMEARLFINAGMGRSLYLPMLATEFGLKISGVSAMEHDELAGEDLNTAYKKCGDYQIHIGEFQPFEQSLILDKLKPDLFIGCPFVGSVFKRESGLTRMHSYRSDASPGGRQLGFTGAVSYGTLLYRALNNGSLFKKLSGRIKRPYKDWWYSQDDPLHYGREGSGNV